MDLEKLRRQSADFRPPVFLFLLKTMKMMDETKTENSIENEENAETPVPELREARWSVISFEKCEANNLTYAEAEKKLEELFAQNVSGLCIVTDEAAAKIR